MNKIKLAFISLVALVGVVSLVPSYSALAAPVDQIEDGIEQVGGNDAGGTLQNRIRVIVNIMLFLLGAVAVVMIVIGGFKYVTSNGDSASITGAKNTIFYSIVGLVVAILAYAIVNFVIDSFK